MKCRAWGQESVRISVIAGVCFSHFSMLFAGCLALVRISGASAIARFGESTVCGVSCANVDCHVIESLCHDLFIGHCLTAPFSFFYCFSVLQFFMSSR